MMSRSLVVVCVLACVVCVYGYPRAKLSMDFDWRFHLGDFAESAPIIDPNYDDSEWRQLNVPHDFVVEGKFDPKADEGHGYLFPNISWYRHKFVIPTEAPESTVWWLTFDGVYRNSDVYLNGHHLGNWPSGYVSFRYNLTQEYLAPAGEENVLVVRVDATYFEGWWYEGGGIYRHVWLEGAEPLLVAPWGVFVRGDVTGTIQNLTAAATITINTTVWNMDSVAHSFSLVSTIFDSKGMQVAAVTTSGLTLPAGGATEQKQTVAVASMSLWSTHSPTMYSLVSQLVPSASPHSLSQIAHNRRARGGKHHHARKLVGARSAIDALEGDSVTTPFGVRKLLFDVDKGFFLNDEFTKVKGMCNHADFGGTGTAMPKTINKFRLQTLMDYGVNALRASHNAQDPEMLDMADQMGLLVWNEERLYNGISDITLKELNALLIRDRNHPSVFMWSLCNEYSCGDATSFTPLKKMVQLLDGTRPVTAAMNHGWYDQGSMSQILDVVGFNYNIGEWSKYHGQNPKQPMTGSETSSAITTRGIYTDNATAGWLSAYDVHQPGWGNYAWQAWQAEDQNVYMEGGFVWTGFDYKGEPTPYAWPCINSHFGMIDIVGFPKDNAFYYQAWWKPQLPMVHILPHWTWPDKVGQSIDVWVYTSAPYVELFLNGKSLGVQAMQTDLHAEWHVTYAPGTLSATAYDKNNKTWATSQWQTAGAAASIELSVEKNSPTELVGDGAETALITVKVLDANGIFQPRAENLINFTVEGAGALLGVGNGNPSCHDSDKATFRYTFGGLARALIQSSLLQPGDADQTVTLTATSAGLESASITLTVHAPESLMIA